MKTLVTCALAIAMSGCGGSGKPSRPATEANTDVEAIADIASADPRVARFHEQLVINGEDLQSDFGGDLTTLGLNARDLQQDDPKHAYDLVLEKVRLVEDAALRREMMRTFFNSDDQP